MSKINNQSQSLYNIDFVQDVLPESASSYSGGALPLLALAAGKIIVPTVGAFIANEVIKDAGSEFVQNIEVDPLQIFGEDGYIPV
ncbi:MAG: hypothetical protein ACFCU7_11795 [Pleurocapsa sp.]